MKVLVYTASSLCNPQFGIQMEKAIEYTNQGHDVVFCYCSGVMSACSANLFQNKAICKACKMGFRQGLKNLPRSVKTIGLKRTETRMDYHYHAFSSVKEIKTFTYKGVELGFAVMSVYITITRDPNPKITNEFLKCINKMIKEGCDLVDSAESIIKQEAPDLIIFFNGRFYDTKPFYNISKNNNINFISTENIGGVRIDEDYRMVEFYNTIPHDHTKAYQRYLESWNRSKLSEEEKIRAGKEFFERRRNGKKAGDKIYTGSQEKGKLPESFDPKKKNIIVFTSSEHEFSAVSPVVDSYYLFPSQYEGIKYISENIGDDDYHIIVRIHPNMKGIEAEYHQELYRLRILKNVTVIAPDETVSTYALLDNAFNVVVFGSTVGAESFYWGKPVVLLGYAAYYYWGVCSIPKSVDQVIGMIKNPIIYPAAKDMAIKYGYYLLSNNLAVKPKYIEITPRAETIFGRKVYLFEYLQLLGSSLLYKLVIMIYSKVLVRFYNNGINFSGIIIG